jgi:hypothetical protein
MESIGANLPAEPLLKISFAYPTVLPAPTGKSWDNSLPQFPQYLLAIFL